MCRAFLTSADRGTRSLAATMPSLHRRFLARSPPRSLTVVLADCRLSYPAFSRLARPRRDALADVQLAVAVAGLPRSVVACGRKFQAMSVPSRQ